MDRSSWPELWRAVYRILEQTIIPEQLGRWVQYLRLVDTRTEDRSPAEGGARARVQMVAPNDFTANWCRDHWRKEIESAFSQVLGLPAELQIDVDSDQVQRGIDLLASAPDPAPPTVSAPESFPRENAHYMSSAPSSGGPSAGAGSGLASGVVITSGQRSSLAEARIDSRYKFESFVVGASNQFAYASAVAVAEQPGRLYNPLFLFSPPGLGKTHLLHAIANHMVAQTPHARVAYLSAEAFVNELIDSLQHRKMSQFRTKYRESYDILLIDDIQFIAGKPTSEEEFFHTFNALYGSQRQIVVSSDRPPKEIEGLEARVRTRFEWGLTADITPPEIETRIAILKGKAERDDIYLPDDVATFLASYIKSNVRELEGVLIRLQAQASLTGAEISLEMAKHELKTSIPEENAMFTIDAIQNAVARHFHLKMQDLKSTTRTRTIAQPRQIAMYLIRKYTGVGFKEIGQCFGGKDHTTILHACQKVEKSLETDRAIREAVESIQNLL